MEKTVSHEERMRRAEEIYARRRKVNENGIRVSSSSVNNTKNKLSLFRKMALQLAICAVIYIIFYLIKNTNYIFSEDVVQKTKELLSYDINFGNVYSQVNSFIEENKNKFSMPAVMENTQKDSNIQENVNVVETEKSEVENSNQVNETIENTNTNETENTLQENNETSTMTNVIDEGGIGGAEVNELEEASADETTKKTQMELDAEYAKNNCSFIVPLKGTVTSRYGAREATEIVSANHKGIDIGANTGTDIYASMEGTVTVVSSEGDFRKTC